MFETTDEDFLFSPSTPTKMSTFGKHVVTLAELLSFQLDLLRLILLVDGEEIVRAGVLF